MGLMGFIARVRSLTSRVLGGDKYVEVKYDPEDMPTDSTEQPDTRTGQMYNGAGNMSKPLPFDFMAALPIEESGGAVPVAYLDPRNESPAADGEGYFVGRDADGNITAVLWLRGNGTGRFNLDKLEVGDGARLPVARDTDAAVSDASTDATFWTWATAVSTALSLTSPGSLTAKVAASSQKLEAE